MGFICRQIIAQKVNENLFYILLTIARTFLQLVYVKTAFTLQRKTQMVLPVRSIADLVLKDFPDYFITFSVTKLASTAKSSRLEIFIYVMTLVL